MSIIRYLAKREPTNGFYLKELSTAGLKANDPETIFILEIMQIIKKHESIDVYSQWHSLDICKQLMYGAPITPIDNPTQTGEYIAHSGLEWQSTRLGSLFSRNGGETWYDINHISTKNKICRFIAKFFKKSPKFLRPHLLYYVNEFPYIPPYDKFLNN